MSDGLRKQIYNNFNLIETDELVEIWQENNHAEWSEDAFSAIEEILRERLGEVPAQSEPILEPEDIEEEYDENSPEFYNSREVLRLEDWLNKAAIVSIVASVVSNLLELQRMQRTVLSYFMGNIEWNSVAWIIAVVIFIFVVGLQCIIIYFPLRALGSTLKILMEMEFNSRRAVKTKNA